MSPAYTIPARRTICHPKEWSEFVPVICNGWALSSIGLPNGRRQVLSILLPGDIHLSGGLFNVPSGYAVEAITETAYRKFKRTELKDLLFEYRELFEMFTNILDEEKVRSDQLVVDLGRRTSVERIAKLILNVASRLAERGMTSDQTFLFPLRHRHIADATGLTPVHVSRVLSEFQRNSLIEINNRSLTITNAAELHQIAGVQ